MSSVQLINQIIQKQLLRIFFFGDSWFQNHGLPQVHKSAALPTIPLRRHHHIAILCKVLGNFYYLFFPDNHKWHIEMNCRKRRCVVCTQHHYNLLYTQSTSSIQPEYLTRYFIQKSNTNILIKTKVNHKYWQTCINHNSWYLYKYYWDWRIYIYIYILYTCSCTALIFYLHCKCNILFVFVLYRELDANFLLKLKNCFCSDIIQQDNRRFYNQRCITFFMKQNQNVTKFTIFCVSFRQICVGCVMGMLRLNTPPRNVHNVTYILECTWYVHIFKL